MYIHEAVRIAMDQDKFIIRENSPFKSVIKIKPTNTDGGCILIPIGVYAEKMPIGKRWQPYAEDLIANDWIVVD